MKIKRWKKWTNEELDLLKHHWGVSDMETLLKTFPDKTYQQIMSTAGYWGFKSSARRSRLNGSIKTLLDETKSSFYMLGFILGDGCLTERGDITISQALKEEDFFINFIIKMGGKKQGIKYRKYKNSYNNSDSECLTFRIGDKDTVEEIKKRIQLENSNKTYNPPKNIEYFLKPNLLGNFLTGLIDADGCIWVSGSSPQIRIEMHYNWIDILNKIKEKMKLFYDIDMKTKISKRGYSQLWFSNVSSIRKMYILAKENKDIYMSRKWNKISECYPELLVTIKSSSLS